MQKLLFIQGGSRWKFDTDGNVYTDSNFNEKIWDRYRNYCDELTVVLRREEKVYSLEEAAEKFNVYNKSKSKYIALPDIYRPSTNIIRLSIRNEINWTIGCEVQKADKVIIRALGDHYTDTAFKFAVRYRKSVLVEVTAFTFETLWYHGLSGKMMAFWKELNQRKVRKSPYAVFVTDEALQKRYPCNGKTLACSDVELPELEQDILDARLKKIAGRGKKTVIGTAAFLDVEWKGQNSVIRAIAELKRLGLTNIEYQLIGSGTGEKLKTLAGKLGVSEQINIVGALPHDQVFTWLDSIDIYVQPSFQEGLCRSIIEAMSRACPVVASDVGGNYELVEKDRLFKPGHYRELSNILCRISKNRVLAEDAKKNFEKVKKYRKSILDVKRDEFYKQFMEKNN